MYPCYYAGDSSQNKGYIVTVKSSWMIDDDDRFAEYYILLNEVNSRRTVTVREVTLGSVMLLLRAWHVRVASCNSRVAVMLTRLSTTSPPPKAELCIKWHRRHLSWSRARVNYVWSATTLPPSEELCMKWHTSIRVIGGVTQVNFLCSLTSPLPKQSSPWNS